tara:strand:+ start:1581 stop:1781 length:201 start_codon:yes stop_codon:yes gene_type:complete
MTSTDAQIDLSSQEDDKSYTLTGEDVATMLSVLNVISARGGFKPSEFKLVGALFEKLSEMRKPDNK